MASLGIESPSSRWFYWVELAGKYALCDPVEPVNSVICMTDSLDEAKAWATL